VYLAVPEDVEIEPAPAGLKPLPLNVVHPEAPSASQVERAAAILREAGNPVLLAGHGAARNHASAALTRFAEHTGVAVATTFHGKGVLADDHPNSMGTIGFMRRDYANFGFDQADVIIAVGYELQEFDPVKINPDGDKEIIHIHRFPAEVDAHYSVSVGIEGDISASLDALREAVPARETHTGVATIRELVADELARGQQDDRFPMSPQRIVADTRAALGRDDIVLVDTGAVKMWMARLYPTYAANTCLISNGLSTMGFALPGALGVHLARPDRRVLAVTGDGSFLMHSQEIETAVREHLPLTVLVWEDSGYGLIEWKMRLETGTVSNVRFRNPEITQYAASFGATGYHVGQASELLPTLRKALDDDGVSIVVAPVDYTENISLTDRLGLLTDPL
jgi:acetolactate synthase-1/2/3 large subunit